MRNPHRRCYLWVAVVAGGGRLMRLPGQVSVADRLRGVGRIVCCSTGHTVASHTK